MNFLVFSSPPKTDIIDFPIYLKAKIKIAKPKINTMKLFVFSNKVFKIGEVIISITFGTLLRGILSPIMEARKREVFENAPKKNSSVKTMKTRIAL